MYRMSRYVMYVCVAGTIVYICMYVCMYVCLFVCMYVFGSLEDSPPSIFSISISIFWSNSMFSS